MASIYRPTYRKDGKLKKVRKWYVRYRDHDGKLKCVPGFTDKSATQQLASKLEREAAMIRSGLVEPAVRFQHESLDSHLRAFELSLRSKQVSERQIAQVLWRCRKLLDECNVKRVTDLHGESVAEALARLREKTDDSAGLSVQTSNHYLKALKQFTRWMRLEKRMSDDPLVRLEILNVRVDRRHDRRALSDQEVGSLLVAAIEGEEYLGFSGEDRQMLYLMALSTGLRASELASLSTESFSLTGNPPTVVVAAAYSKHRREDVLPLPAELLPHLASYLATKRPGDKLWPGDWAEHRYAGKLLQKDLKRAGVVYRDGQGRFADFHALRHTFITNLGRHGVSLTTAQKLARHSTPVLTAARYTHVDLAEQKRAVDKIPLQRPLQRTIGFSCPKEAKDGTPKHEPVEPDNAEKPLEKQGFSAFSKRRGRDSNPGTSYPVSGFQDRCIRPLCHLSRDLSTAGMPRSTRPSRTPSLSDHRYPAKPSSADRKGPSA